MPLSRRAVLLAGGIAALSATEAQARRPRRSCVCTPPPASATPIMIANHPPLLAWKKIEKGMTEQQVLDLLGEPVQRMPREPSPKSRINSDKYWYPWLYGELRFHSDAFPADSPFLFQVRFHKGIVEDCLDPFDHEILDNGHPTTPKSLTPPDRTTFKNNSPRWLDLRWGPVAGEGVITYDVEVNTNIYADELLRMRRDLVVVSQSTQIPYLPFWASGMPGWWRVRARNHLAASEWIAMQRFSYED